jgi:hypothetical protein
MTYRLEGYHPLTDRHTEKVPAEYVYLHLHVNEVGRGQVQVTDSKFLPALVEYLGRSGAPQDPLGVQVQTQADRQRQMGVDLQGSHLTKVLNAMPLVVKVSVHLHLQ